jgi:hypothetical protein
MIEYAATTTAAPEEMIRSKLRNAPEAIKRDFDRERERRGLSPLFAVERAASAVAAPPAAKPPRMIRLNLQRVLVGVAAPGLSKPAPIKGDEKIVPERIMPSAWACVERDLRAGKHFPILDGHAGAVIGTTDSPRFTWSIDPKIGLRFTLQHSGEGTAWPAGGFCSIGMRARRWEHRFAAGGFVREIHEMSLAHIAILTPVNRAAPCYPLARVRSVKPDQAAREALRLLLDTRIAVGEQ